MEITLTTENFESEVLKSDVPVIVDFWATWCGPCQMLAPIIEEISNEYSGVKVGKVNVDDEESLAMQYGIMSIPTVMLFKDGAKTDYLIGYATKEDLVKKFGLVK
ncbi:MAG: thioredoxin [Treponema sp.]|nr:thioredoxin [Treponema sp.]